MWYQFHYLKRTIKILQGFLPPRSPFSFVFITTGILQGVNPLSSIYLNFHLISVMPVLLTAGNNRNLARGPPTEFYFLLCFYNNRNFTRGYPTEFSFLFCFYNNRNFARGSPTEFSFLLYFDNSRNFAKISLTELSFFLLWFIWEIW